jgi:hypothetical protein
MTQMRHGPRFAAEAPQRPCLAEGAADHYLDGHRSVEAQVRRVIHGAHAALPDQPIEAVLAVDGARHRQRQPERAAVMRAPFRVAIKTGSACRTFPQQIGAARVEPGQHFVFDPLVLADLGLQAEILADHGELLGNAFQQFPVARGVRLFGLLFRQHQHADEAIGAVGNGYDERRAALRQPVRVVPRQPRLRWQREGCSSGALLEPREPSAGTGKIRRRQEWVR